MERVLVDGSLVDVLYDVDLSLGGPVLALGEEARPDGALETGIKGSHEASGARNEGRTP